MTLATLVVIFPGLPTNHFASSFRCRLLSLQSFQIFKLPEMARTATETQVLALDLVK